MFTDKVTVYKIVIRTRVLVGRGWYLSSGYETLRRWGFGSPVPSCLMMSPAFWHHWTVFEEVSLLPTAEAELLPHPPLSLGWGQSGLSQLHGFIHRILTWFWVLLGSLVGGSA